MLARKGAFEDPSEQPYCTPFLKPLSEQELAGASVDDATGVVTKDGEGVGILHHGHPVVGFKTPSRELEVRSEFVARTGRRSLTLAKATPDLGLGSGGLARTLRLPVWITPGVHPRAIALWNSLGHREHTNVARGVRGAFDVGERARGMDMAGFRDPDRERNMWWEDTSGGAPKQWTKIRGNGWAQNQVLPIMADHFSGQQAFNDTVDTMRKVT